MTRNAYVDFCLSVQAARRHFECIRTPLAPAIGVAADIYTHQVANVHRVLTDVRVRHLLADEVGLGKTVQALMILNALRNQRPDFRALIIVPDRLVVQWRDEIMNRAHTAPIDADEEAVVEGGRYIRLAWEAQLRTPDARGAPRLQLSDIDPNQFDLLIVDELHHLREDIRNRIVRVAADFQHLLVLTATPAFQRIERHAQLFALLEPERSAIARSRIACSELGVAEELSVNDDLSKWPEWAATEIVSELIDRDTAAASRCGSDELNGNALAHCAYRRVIRTRRADYSGILPRRQHRPLVVEPLGAEADRQTLMWRYFSHLEHLSRRFDPVLLAKRVILSPPSLEQRVDFLRREGHEREGLLERVKPLVHRSQGDSRADALIDLLAEVWTRNSAERVLVAAQDNLTVDYLFDLVRARLPVIGPLHNRVPLVAARVRQGMMTEAVENLAGFGNETNENLEAFQRGEAQILFAPEAAQVGLNLQCARILVLYSVPWSPEEVEQWIGRLDRIGNVAAVSSQGRAKDIDVYTIVQRGLVDERVVTVLRCFQVFERSVNLDGDRVDEVAKRIESAALRAETASWAELERVTEAIADEDDVRELRSALKPYLPWNVSTAMEVRQCLDGLPPASPVLVELRGDYTTGPRAWDRAFEGMLKLLAASGDFHIRWNTDPDTGSRFQTLWYAFGEPGMYGHRELKSKVVFNFGADPGHDRSPRHAHAFITRRKDIATPPCRSVTLLLEHSSSRRPLRFLNFGDSLHDELVDGWLPKDGTPHFVDVAFAQDHAFWKHGKPGLYVISVSVLDPAAAILSGDVKSNVMQAIGHAATRSAPERLPDLVLPFVRAVRCAIESDIRWLRAHLTATMRIEARRGTREGWAVPGAEEVNALLNPLAHPRKRPPPSAELSLGKDTLEAAMDQLSHMRELSRAAAATHWSHCLSEFESALQWRLIVIREEARDANSLVRDVYERAEQTLRAAIERGIRPQITRAENALAAAADNRDMTVAFWCQRETWLQKCQQLVRSTCPVEQLAGVLRVRSAN